MQRGKSSSSSGRRRHSSNRDNSANNLSMTTTSTPFFNNNGFGRAGPPFPLATSHKGANFKGGKGKGHKGGHGWRPLNGGGGGGGAGSGQHLKHWGPGKGAGKGKGGSPYGNHDNGSGSSSSSSGGKGSFGDNLQRTHWHRLHAACILGDLDFARAALLEVADDPTAQAAAVGAADEDGLLAWHFAALVGLVPLLELLAGPMIASGVPLETRAGGGQTALHLAAEQGHLDAVEWLLAGPLCGLNSSNRHKILPPLPLFFGEDDFAGGNVVVGEEESSGSHDSVYKNADEHSNGGFEGGASAVSFGQEEGVHYDDDGSPLPSSSSSSRPSLVPQGAVTRRGLTALHLAVLNGHSQVFSCA